MSTTVYKHPDGHEITVGHGLLTAVSAEGIVNVLELGVANLPKHEGAQQ